MLQVLSVNMNYDEYIQKAKKFSDDEVVSQLIQHLLAWKFDSSDVVDLADSVERFFGNSWIEAGGTHNHLYLLWSKFKVEAVDGIGGMTMNERLYWFGLFEQFDGSQSEATKKIIYGKLSAHI